MFMLDAPPHRPLPRMNTAIEKMSGMRRPKMLASWPKRGWRAVLRAVC